VSSYQRFDDALDGITHKVLTEAIVNGLRHDPLRIATPTATAVRSDRTPMREHVMSYANWSRLTATRTTFRPRRWIPSDTPVNESDRFDRARVAAQPRFQAKLHTPRRRHGSAR